MASLQEVVNEPAMAPSHNISMTDACVGEKRELESPPTDEVEATIQRNAGENKVNFNEVHERTCCTTGQTEKNRECIEERLAKLDVR